MMNDAKDNANSSPTLDLEFPTNERFAQDVVDDVYVAVKEKYVKEIADSIQIPDMSDVTTMLQQSVESPWFKSEVLHEGKQHLVAKGGLDVAVVVAQSPSFQQFVADAIQVVNQFPDREQRSELARRIAQTVGEVLVDVQEETETTKRGDAR